jgi:hypothetical protein
MGFKPRLWSFLAVLAFAPTLHADPQPVQRLLVIVPQTDDQAAGAIKALERHPQLRVVWAVSPRFFRSPKEALYKARLKELEQQGQIAVALQIPNAPFLPLLLNTSDAQGAIPTDHALPALPYSSSDDVLQHVIRARTDFIKSWGAPPKGLILPYGAASPALVNMLSGQPFDWIVGALALPGPVTGAYRVGEGVFSSKAVTLWDASEPQNPASSVRVTVWDEREQKGVGGAKTLDAWGKEIERNSTKTILPGDTGLAEPQKLDAALIQRRTWTQADWSAWIGVPEKNNVWSALRQTREALNAYQNSGQAQLPRLEAALEEFLTAENGTFLLYAGSATLTDVEREDRARDFETTLGSVYRLIGQTPPDDLLKPVDAESAVTTAAAPMTVTADVLPDGRGDHLRLADAVATLEVIASSETLTWTAALSMSVPNETIDIYVDVNGIPNIGSTALLPGRGLSVRPENAWEYALSISGAHATLYRTRGTDQFMAAGEYTALWNDRAITLIFPRTDMRGNVRRWGYRVLMLDKDLHVLHALERPYR